MIIHYTMTGIKNQQMIDFDFQADFEINANFVF